MADVSVTPEQKQRIEQIEGRLTDYGFFTGSTYDAQQDIDFLLSLVKSQEAATVTPFCPVHAAIEQKSGLTLEVGNDCVACSLNERSAILNLIEPFAADDKTEDSLTVLQKIINGEPMRSACVEELKELARQRVQQSKPNHKDHEYDQAVAFVLLQAAEKLESLSIEKQEG